MKKTGKEWREVLTPEQYRVTREAGTEAPFSGEYVDHWDAGSYQCVCCGHPLFGSGSNANGNFVRCAGAFTTNPIYTGRGGYLHHNSASLTGGRVFLQASGGATPSGMSAGDILLEY